MAWRRINGLTVKQDKNYDILFFCTLVNKLLYEGTLNREISWNYHVPLPGSYSCKWNEREFILDIVEGLFVSMQYGEGTTVEFCFDVFGNGDPYNIQKLRDAVLEKEEEFRKHVESGYEGPPIGLLLED